MGRAAYRGGYAARPSQDNPLVMIPTLIYARIVIAADELGISPGEWVELELREGLKRHGVGMEDAAYAAACRNAEQQMRANPTRHEFDATRPKRRPTDP